MEDTRNIIDQTLARAEIINGEVPSPDELATVFAKLNETERVDTLERISADLADSDLSVGKAAKLFLYGSALKRTHETLRKVNR